MLKEILKILSDFDIISFDIFDTLLLRTYYAPKDLWQDMEEREGAAGFALARFEIDRKLFTLARTNGGEPSLDDMYSGIPKWENMKERELAYEREAIRVNPEMLEVWQKAEELGKKRILVSDMYLPQEFIEELLNRNGISGWDELYLSNSRQLKKRDGGLFRKVLDEQKCPADRILHIGDDAYSDVTMPNKLGIVAYLYSKVIDKFLEECRFLKSFLGDGKSFEKRRLVGCLAVGWHTFKCDHPDWSYWSRLGFLFAGTLGYMYMRFVGEEAKRLGITHLMMVARDCFILEKIFNLLYPDIKTDYFYASRLSALLTMQYFGSFGIGMINRRKFCLEYLKKQNIAINDDESSHFIETGELSRETKQAFDNLSNMERRQAENYFSQFHINHVNTAIVDGASGHFTVQKFVSDVVGKDIFTFYLQTLRPPQNAETLYQCGWFDARYLMLSEFLFAAPYNSVERVIDGKPVFKKEIHNLEKIKISVSSEIEEGALACAKILNQSNCVFPKYTWLDFNDAFMDNQTVEDKEMLSIACDSMATDHNSEFIPVVRKLPPDRSKRLFRIRLLTIQRERVGENYKNIMYLFGKYRLLDYDKIYVFFKKDGFLRKTYRWLRGHDKYASNDVSGHFS